MGYYFAIVGVIILLGSIWITFKYTLALFDFAGGVRTEGKVVGVEERKEGIVGHIRKRSRAP